MDLLKDLENVDPIFWRRGRLQTYSDWPFQNDSKCTAERMAAAGFMFVGGKNEPDLVECFICTKQLNEWDSDDDPWNEHKKHMPECPYVQLDKQDELKWTVMELFKLQKEYLKTSLVKTHKRAINELKTEAAEMAKEIPKGRKKSRSTRKR